VSKKMAYQQEKKLLNVERQVKHWKRFASSVQRTGIADGRAIDNFLPEQIYSKRTKSKDL
jgi:hypothetical protein